MARIMRAHLCAAHLAQQRGRGVVQTCRQLLQHEPVALHRHTAVRAQRAIGAEEVASVRRIVHPVDPEPGGEREEGGPWLPFWPSQLPWSAARLFMNIAGARLLL